VVLVSLDGEPLAKSRKMLLQVMSEEQNSGFQTEQVATEIKKITRLGSNPWEVKEISGRVELKNKKDLRITPLDFNGYSKGEAQNATEMTLQPQTIYYLVTRN
jgi:hypothetical protein